MTNETIKNLIERRSVKKYRSEQIKDEELNAVLDAARYTASGHNRQPVRLVVLQEAETIKKLSAMNAKILGRDGDPFYGAPTVIVVLADTASATYIQDGSLVLGNLMNAAHSIGLGSCWINRAKEEFECEEGKTLLKKWGIEGNYAGIGHCILGYADGAYPKPSPRREGFVTFVK